MLAEYFCFKYRRVVARDNTVSFEGYRLDIPRQPGGSLARARIEVQQRFDGTLAVYNKGICLVTKLLDDPPASTRVGADSPATDEPAPPQAPAPNRSPAAWKPDAGHPWRR